MKTVVRRFRNPAGILQHLSGFALIELMVATLLGLIVIVGVISILVAAWQSYRTSEALGEVGSASRMAFYLMARDIRAAGLNGCDSIDNRVVNVTKAFNRGTAPAVWWSDWTNVVHGYGSGADPDPAIVATMPAQVAGTDSIQLIGADFSAVAIEYETPGTGFTLDAPLPNMRSGDVAIVCSPQQAAIMQLDYAAGVAKFAVAGNCSTNLGFPNKECTGNIDYVFPPNSMMSLLAAKDWYVGTNTSGGKSLFRVSIENFGGAPTPVAREMVRGVCAMSIGYLAPGDASIANRFVPASVISARRDWSGVAAIRVKLLVRSSTVIDSDSVARTYEFTTALRNRMI